MAYLADTVLDGALDVLRLNADTVHLTTSEVTSFGSLAAATLGSAAVSIGAVGNGSPNGRQVTVPAITDAAVTLAGQASHWCLVGGSTVFASGTLGSTVTLNSTSDTWNLDAFDIRIADAT